MENTAQASIKLSRSRRRSRRRGVYLPQKMAQFATMEAPQLASRPWLADIDSAATPNERALLFWLDAAARFHTDPVRDVMVAIKTVEHPATQPGSQSNPARSTSKRNLVGTESRSHRRQILSWHKRHDRRSQRASHRQQQLRSSCRKPRDQSIRDRQRGLMKLIDAKRKQPIDCSTRCDGRKQRW